MSLTKNQRVKELLQKVDGAPTGNSDNPIPYGYPGLSIDEAIELQMLISGSSSQKATVAIRHAREGCPMDL